MLCRILTICKIQKLKLNNLTKSWKVIVWTCLQMSKMEWIWWKSPSKPALPLRTVTVIKVLRGSHRKARQVHWVNLLILEHSIIPRLINYNRLRQLQLPPVNIHIKRKPPSITFTKIHCNPSSYLWNHTCHKHTCHKLISRLACLLRLAVRLPNLAE